MDPKHFVVVLGGDDWSHDENCQQIRNISRIAAYPNLLSHEYDRKYDIDADIAVVELSEPVDFNECVQPACLPNINASDLLPDTMTSILGWGRTEDEKDPDTLNIISQSVMSHNQCLGWFLNLNFSTLICVHSPTNAGAGCKGDSGGPVMWKNPQDERWYLRGIISRGDGFCSRGGPTVSVRINYFSKWIESIVGIQ